MYDYLRDMLNLADIVKDVDGTVDTVDMGDIIPGTDRIRICGSTAEGKRFEITLEVEQCKESE